MSELIDHTLRGSWTAAGASATTLPAHAMARLRQRLGLNGEMTPAAPASLLEVPESALPGAARAALGKLVGDRYVLTGTAGRLGRSGGLSYVDLMRRRSGADLAVPDCVVLPADPDQVQQVLDLCVQHDIAVVPFGGGTSVVGGVNPLRGDKSAVLVLDLARLDRMVALDPVSRIARLQAGVRAPEAEAMLAERGFTLGHVPQSYERATIGGFAATRSAGQASSGYGRFEDMVQRVRLATPAGQWHLGAAPASAAGPDLRQLAIGSEGTFGVITEVALRVRSLPEQTKYEAWVLDGWRTGTAAVRRMAQTHSLADVTRLSDPDETEIQFELAGGTKTRALRALLRIRAMREPCLLILGWEVTSTRELERRRATTLRALRGFRSIPLGGKAGESWREHRFGGPRQRDALLDFGMCVETLETAADWAKLAELRTAIRGALARELTVSGRPPIVMCHVSHAYETGASLYFTVLARRDPRDPIGQWQHAKVAASDAISGAGTVRGTITHHHAVGIDHQPWLSGEIGTVGMRVLEGVKAEVDPTRILNPAKLVAEKSRI